MDGLLAFPSQTPSRSPALCNRDSSIRSRVSCFMFMPPRLLLGRNIPSGLSLPYSLSLFLSLDRSNCLLPFLLPFWAVCMAALIPPVMSRSRWKKSKETAARSHTANPRSVNPPILPSTSPPPPFPNSVPRRANRSQVSPLPLLRFPWHPSVCRPFSLPSFPPHYYWAGWLAAAAETGHHANE